MTRLGNDICTYRVNEDDDRTGRHTQKLRLKDIEAERLIDEQTAECAKTADDRGTELSLALHEEEPWTLTLKR